MSSLEKPYSAAVIHIGVDCANGGARVRSRFFISTCPGSVAKSTHAGLPWLRFLRQRLGERVHFWPFDGWKPEAGRHVIAEVYPSLWNKTYPREDRGPDQHDAYSVARWLQETDIAGELCEFLMPDLGSEIRNLANIEGWILGVR